MEKGTKLLNYIKFTKEIAGPPNKDRLKQAKEIL